MGVELHFESKKLRAIAEAVRNASLPPATKLPPLEWDLDWLGGNSRLRAVLPEDSGAPKLASAMVELIRLTRPVVDRALAAVRT
jgi:hypothetical protein